MSLKTIIDSVLSEKLKFIVHKCYHTCIVLFNKLRWLAFGKRLKNSKDIPIIINNFNRLTYLKSLINSLTSRGYHNIYILDNQSTYPPLLEYYQTCPYHVILLDKNLGYKALWISDVFKQFKDSYYVYTDSDMEISEECPDDFMQHFLNVLHQYPLSQKVGFGLRIDDLPDYFENKQKVIAHETRFWQHPVANELYKAEIDTTFALYRPYCKGVANIYSEVYRTSTPYLIRHLPWYVNSENMSEEEQYYVNNITQSTHWSKQAQK